MKDILGHRSWTESEIIMILRRTNNFTCCVLPHYRFDRVKSVCRRLLKKGWIEKTGRTEVAVNYKMTDAMRQHFWLDGKDLV